MHKQRIDKILVPQQFHKRKPSFYKLTHKQIQQLINYLIKETTQEELNNALGYMSHCPYCNSKNFYRINRKSNLYRWKCEDCDKEFNILSRSSLSPLFRDESIKHNKRLTHEKSLKDIEVWLYYDIDYDRHDYSLIARTNIVSTAFRWKHNMLQIPSDLKKDHLVNIYEHDEASFYRLINYQSKTIRQKKRHQSNKKFIILTFKEGAFTPKKSISEYNNPLTSSINSPFESYINDDRAKKSQEQYDDLKENLIQSYNEECVSLQMPSRSDEVYKNIENSYKHTYSLAYEMAIRNKDVKKILYALGYLNNLKTNILAITKQYYKDKGSAVAISEKADATHDSSIEKYIEILISKYPNYLTAELHHKYVSIGLHRISTMIDEFEEELRIEYLIVPKNKKIITPEANHILIQRAIYNSIDPKKYKWYPNYQQKNRYEYEEKEYSEYTVTMGVFEDDDEFDVNVIRPTFNSHIVDKNISLVPINFTLPEEEILAFIKKIKEDMRKDGSIIKTPMELLGEELEKIEEAKVKEYLPKTFKANLKVMANALFAYDVSHYLTQGKDKLVNKRDNLINKRDSELLPYKKPGRRTEREDRKVQKIEKIYEEEIQKYEKEIDKFNKTSIEKKVRVGETTLKRYIAFMDEYIGEKKYRKLFIKTR